MSQPIVSCPSYRPLAPDATGRVHLLVSDQSALRQEWLADDVGPDDFDERWFIARDSKAIPVPGASEQDQMFRSEKHLLIALSHRLARERMGLRLYACGSEPFVWEVNNLGASQGLGRSEMRHFAVGSRARRVFCNHCRTITEGVTTSIVACSGCGANLFVRDHFSRRLNAYAGFQVDAEEPGNVPPAEEIYT